MSMDVKTDFGVVTIKKITDSTFNKTQTRLLAPTAVSLANDFLQYASEHGGIEGVAKGYQERDLEHFKRETPFDRALRNGFDDYACNFIDGCDHWYTAVGAQKYQNYEINPAAFDLRSDWEMAVREVAEFILEKRDGITF